MWSVRSISTAITRRLHRKDSDVAPDPLMVCSVEDAIAMLELSDRDEDEPLMIEFAPDALHKANISGGGPYAIEVPNPVADGQVEDAPHDVTFVEYLRDAILGWGGFPGWEGAQDPPRAGTESACARA